MNKVLNFSYEAILTIRKSVHGYYYYVFDITQSPHGPDSFSWWRQERDAEFTTEADAEDDARERLQGYLAKYAEEVAPVADKTADNKWRQ